MGMSHRRMVSRLSMTAGSLPSAPWMGPSIHVGGAKLCHSGAASVRGGRTSHAPKMSTIKRNEAMTSLAMLLSQNKEPNIGAREDFGRLVALVEPFVKRRGPCGLALARQRDEFGRVAV